MELVYLWVEEYKNIHEQGFNFSPRFNCKYDPDSNELTINDNDDYIENFFGKNINVTAIVGKNGSGKSSVINILAESTMRKKTFLIVYIVDNVTYYFSNSAISSDLIKSEELENVTIKSYFSDNQLYYSEDYTFKFSDGQSSNDIMNNRFFLNDYIIANMLSHQYISRINFHLTTFMYIPKIIEIIPTLNEAKSNIIDDESYSPITDFPNSINEWSDRTWEQNRKNIRNQKFAREDNLNDLFFRDKYPLDEYHQFLILWYISEYGYDETECQLDDKEFLIKEFKDSDSYISKDEFKKYFREKTIEIDTLSDRDKDIYFNYYEKYFKFDFIDSKERRYQQLSYGERTIFGQLLSIYYTSCTSRKLNFLYFFDEPDISLHPNWQKNYLEELLSLLNRLHNKNFHFIFTTHSPFLLSDIPKQNIIFLDTYKKDEEEVKSKNQKVGNCRVLPHDEVLVKKQTFGANIHTLLSDSFFMEDGLMGEFAKGKINKILRFLSGKNTFIDFPIKDIRQTIELIGEPFLKDKLLRMYDEKYPQTDEEKIKALEAQIKSIKNAQD